MGNARKQGRKRGREAEFVTRAETLQNRGGNMGAYIPDGQTAKGYVPEERNGASVLWEPCRFAYRPATAPEVEALGMSASAIQVEQRRVKFLADHVVSWDLRYNGDVLPVSSDVLSRLQHGFRTTLLNIITGQWHSDPDPDDVAAAKTVDLVGSAGN